MTWLFWKDQGSVFISSFFCHLLKILAGCVSAISRSPHTNNQYESWIFATNFCLLTFWVNIGKIKVLNYGQNTSKNANITLYTKKIKALCNTLNWGNWNSGFVKLVVRWAERDTFIMHYNFVPRLPLTNQIKISLILSNQSYLELFILDIFVQINVLRSNNL